MEVQYISNRVKICIPYIENMYTLHVGYCIRYMYFRSWFNYEFIQTFGIGYQYVLYKIWHSWGNLNHYIDVELGPIR